MMDICMIGTILVSCILMKLFVTGAIPRWSRRQRNKTCRRIKGNAARKLYEETIQQTRSERYGDFRRYHCGIGGISSVCPG